MNIYKSFKCQFYCLYSIEDSSKQRKEKMMERNVKKTILKIESIDPLRNVHEKMKKQEIIIYILYRPSKLFIHMHV